VAPIYGFAYATNFCGISNLLSNPRNSFALSLVFGVMLQPLAAFPMMPEKGWAERTGVLGTAAAEVRGSLFCWWV